MVGFKMIKKNNLINRYTALLLSVLIAISAFGGIIGTVAIAQGQNLTATESHTVYSDDFSNASTIDDWRWAAVDNTSYTQYTASIADGKMTFNNANAGGSFLHGLRFLPDKKFTEQRVEVTFNAQKGLKPCLWGRVNQTYKGNSQSIYGYYLLFNCNQNGNLTLDLSKRMGTSSVEIGKISYGNTITQGQEYRMEMVMQGTNPTLISVSLYTKVGSVENAVVCHNIFIDREQSLQTAGSAGVSAARTSAVSETNVSIEDFEFTSTDNVTGKYYVEEGTTGSKTFGQVVMLDSTKKYILAAYAKDNGTNSGGELVNPLWIEYFNKNNTNTRVLTGRGSLKSNRTQQAAESAGIEYNEKFTVFYDEFDLSACTDKKTESGIGNKTRVIVGFRCDGSTATAGMFTHFTLYAADDANKTNLLINPDFKMGLYGWNEEAGSYMNYTQMKESQGVTAKGFATLKSASDDEYNQMFKNNDYTVPVEPPKEYMLKNTGTVSDSKFGQIVSLDLDTEYVYSVNYKYDTQNGSKPSIWYKNTDGEYKLFENYIIASEEITQSKSVYRFNSSVSDILNDNGKGTFLIGYISGSTGAQGYFRNFELYRNEDSSKSNIIKNSDFSSGLKYWTASCYNSFTAIEDETVMSTEDGSATLIEFTDENFFSRNNFPEGKWVIHNNGQKAYGKIGNIVYLDPSKTYVYGVSYKYLDQKSSKPFILYNNAEGTLTNYDPDSVSSKITNDEDYYRSYYEFNIPTDAKKEPDGTVKMKIGFTTGNQGADAYYGDFLLYDKNDSAKTNLLKNSDFADGFKDWAEEGTPITSSDVYGLTGADLVFVTNDIFKRPTINKLEGNWVIHNTGAVEYAKFGQIVELDPNKTYVYAVSYKYIDQKGSMPFMRYYDGITYQNFESGYISEKQDAELYRVYYEFKAPPVEAVLGNGKVRMQIGVTCGMGGADTYFGDFLLYEKDDINKTNIFDNADFALGLYGWTSNGYNNMPISDYGVMTTIQGDVELIQVADDYFARPKVDKLEGNWVIHNTGKVEYAKFGQIVELDTDKTYMYEVSYKYKDQKGSMPYMLYFDGSTYVNYTDFVSVTQDETKYREYYEFKIPSGAAVQANGKVKMKIGLTCGMAEADAYFGDFLLYDKADKEKTNIFINADFALGLYGWTSNGYNNLPISDYGVMTTIKGDVELVKVEDDFFNRPVFEKLKGNWVIHNTGKVEYAKFGQIVELEPDKTYVYEVSYKYEDQKGSMPFMRYFDGKSYLNCTEFISETQDDDYYRAVYVFKAPKEAAVQSNGKVKMQIGITCGALGADAYFGDFLLYDKDDKEKTNIFTNADFALGLYGWTSNGYNNLSISDYVMTTVQGDVELVKKEEDFFKRPYFEKLTEEPMIHITGKWNYAHPGQIVELTPGKTYYYSMYEKYFTQNGCKPLVFVKRDGSYEALAKELEVKSQDLKNCFTVYSFTVPKDIDVRTNGNSEVLVGFTTGITGADVYFYDLNLYSADDADKTNLFVNPDFELGLYGWTGTSYNYKPETEYGIMTFRYKEEAELLPYDASIFVNDLSDEFFNDGDWASEYGADYTMEEWFKKLGFDISTGSSGNSSEVKDVSGLKLSYIIILAVAGGIALIAAGSVVFIIIRKKRKDRRK